jgi:hypothetical protein
VGNDDGLLVGSKVGSKVGSTIEGENSDGVSVGSPAKINTLLPSVKTEYKE